MCQTGLPDSLFDEDVGVSCRTGLPAWALVVYVSSVESREPIIKEQIYKVYVLEAKVSIDMCTFTNAIISSHMG